MKKNESTTLDQYICEISIRFKHDAIDHDILY